MYLKWQGQFWRACCSSASSASDGAAARTLCWWLLGAGLRCCSPTAQQADVGDALADPTGRETTPCCIPHSAGENGRRGCSDGRRWLEARPSSCALKKCLSGALWRKSSISVPFHATFCYSSCRPVWAVLFTCEILPSSLGLFLWRLAAQAWLQPCSLHATTAAASNKLHLPKESLKKSQG